MAPSVVGRAGLGLACLQCAGLAFASPALLCDVSAGAWGSSFLQRFRQWRPAAAGSPSDLGDPVAASISIGAVGDVLLHEELQIQARQSPKRARQLWEPVAELLRALDVTYANLETPLAHDVALQGHPKNKREAMLSPCQIKEAALRHSRTGSDFDGVVYTGFPRFDVHASLAEDLREDGLDVVSTANNHASDRCRQGIAETLAALSAAKLPYTGTRKSTSEPWHTVTRAGGISVAWLACNSAGGHRIEWQEWASRNNSAVILSCNDTDHISSLVSRLARQQDVDAVIVTPHWGQEFGLGPSAVQREQARRWLDAGAIAILGNHAHIPQEMEDYTTKDGRRTFISYCIGTFVSHRFQQLDDSKDLMARSSIFFLLRLAKTRQGVTRLANVRYVPLFVHRTPARSCPGCVCPKPFGETVEVSKQACPTYQVKAADRALADGGQETWDWMQHLLGSEQLLTYDQAMDWVRSNSSAEQTRG